MHQVQFFAEVSILGRALHPFIVHRQETASDFKILSNQYRYPSQIILRWPLFVSTSVTSILFEILKLIEKSIHIYLPLGVHVEFLFSDSHSNSNIFVSIVRENVYLSTIENHIYLDLFIVKNLKKIDYFLSLFI